ncbi:MAG: nuclear transport factor 2 family protein [Stackebrandtia sp.]
MSISIEDRTAITDLVSLHGHFVDAGELDRLTELFTMDATYDVSDFGQPPLRGLAAVEQAALDLGDANPVGHHVTNVVITEVGDNAVSVRSKGIGVNADGGCGSVTYLDTVIRTDDGWRISFRKLRAHRAALGRG